MRHDIFRHHILGQIWESDVIDCTEEEWAVWPLASDPRWVIIERRDWVFANRIIPSPEFERTYRPCGSRPRPA
jgi:hypothetical protein